ncbi:MAG: hypothetical protein VKK99_07930 [Cyanobacteriota bacterium]|nr:hypothetical protein [Cyanobacteriota bacterium]
MEDINGKKHDPQGQAFTGGLQDRREKIEEDQLPFLSGSLPNQNCSWLPIAKGLDDLRNKPAGKGQEFDQAANIF